jgi:hypothetical protein
MPIRRHVNVQAEGSLAYSAPPTAMINDTFVRRFKELEESYRQLRFQPSSSGSGTYVDTGEWQRWATSAQNLILAVFGEQSPHYQNFAQAFKDCSGYDYRVRTLLGVFQSAKDDFEGGYVFNVDLRVSGEVFGDFVVLAKQALSNGKKDVAAVLACAALEDALKRYAAVSGLDVTDKTMQDVVNALKGKGLVAGAQKSLLDTMPRIRNIALHADWEKLSEPDVNSVIGFVEQFLLSKFGGG